MTITIAARGDLEAVRRPAAGYRLRGALGQVLKRSASLDARADHPCSFDPPCAASIFHGTLRRDGQDLPKPYVLQVEVERDLAFFRCRLAGHAVGWVSAFAEALTVAIAEHGLHQRRNQVAQYEVVARVIDEDVVPCLSVDGPVLLRFASPLTMHTGSDVFFDPRSFVRGLERRIAGLAAWHGFALQSHPEGIERATQFFLSSEAGNIRWAAPWQVGQSKSRRAARTGIVGEVLLPSVDETLAHMLSLGALMGAGGKTTEGLGKLELFSAELDAAEI